MPLLPPSLQLKYIVPAILTGTTLAWKNTEFLEQYSAVPNEADEMYSNFTYDSSEACPDININYKDIGINIFNAWKKSGKSDIVSYWSPFVGFHSYLYAAHLGSVKSITEASGITEKKFHFMISNPYVWCGLWATNMPFGGAKIINKQKAIKDKQISQALLTRNEDPVKISKLHGIVDVSQDMYVQRIPKPNKRFYMSSFLAQTLYGHTLIGSVRHSIMVVNGEVFAVWIGVGKGKSLSPMAGKINDIVACNSFLGIWGLQARNLRTAFHNELYMGAVSEFMEGDMYARFQAYRKMEEFAPKIVFNSAEFYAQYLNQFFSGFVRYPSRIKGYLKGNEGGVKI